MRTRVASHIHRLQYGVIATMVTLMLVAISACGTTPANSSGGSTNAGMSATATASATAGEPTPTMQTTISPTPGQPVQIETRTIATGLEAPWGLAFLPDGRALVSERDSGRVLRVTAQGQVEEVQQLPSNGSGEGGLLGLAISPNFATDGFVYAYYSTNNDNRVVRFRLGEQPQAILTGIPVSGIHNGGRIAFGPDGMLYVGTGDAASRPNSQDRNSLGGKILRIMPDGGIPGDNPFPNSRVYSLGHRNVQGLAWDANGQLYASEFGQNRFDEVNRILPGRNYGWPEVEGQGNDNRFMNPIATFTTDEASPSGATILNGGAIPQWEGNFFMAGLRGERLWRLVINSDGQVTQREALYTDEFGRLRHVAQAPDGSLWVLTSNRDGRGSPISSDDRIIRIGPGT